MKSRIAALMAVLCLSLLAVPALGADATARARLQAFANGLHTLTGHFTQTLTDANGHPGRTSVGTLALEAPRQFRWETTSPYHQLIVADGSRVWLYDPELEQVTVRKQSAEEAHSPLTVLTDMSQLDRDFKVTELGTRKGLQWLRLAPAGGSAQFDYAELGFDGDALRQMVFRDQVGNTTDIRFSDWRRNGSLPDTLFTFTPPDGADVVGDLPVSEVHPLGH